MTIVEYRPDSLVGFHDSGWDGIDREATIAEYERMVTGELGHSVTFTRISDCVQSSDTRIIGDIDGSTIIDAMERVFSNQDFWVAQEDNDKGER